MLLRQKQLMKEKDKPVAGEKTSDEAARAIRIIKIVMALFIMIPLILAWCFGALRF